VLEEPGAELHPQDPPHRIVDPRHRDPVLRQQLLAVEARKPQAAFLVSLVATLSGTSWQLMANIL